MCTIIITSVHNVILTTKLTNYQFFIKLTLLIKINSLNKYYYRYCSAYVTFIVDGIKIWQTKSRQLESWKACTLAVLLQLGVFFE